MAKNSNAIDDATKLQIITMYAEGLSYSKIANELGISPNTVGRWVNKTKVSTLKADDKSKNEDINGIDISNLSEQTVVDILAIRGNISSIIHKIKDELDDVQIEKIKGVTDALMTAHDYLIKTNEIDVKKDDVLKIKVV